MVRTKQMGVTKLSQLSIDANLAMGAHNITLGAGQTVDGKDVGGLGVGDMLKTTYDTDADNLVDRNAIIRGVASNAEALLKAASANVRNSHDAEVSTTSDSYVLKKTITLAYGLKGTIRLLFDIMRAGAVGTAYGKILQNGVTLIGAEQTDTTGAYVTKSQDITVDVLPGGTLELWGCKSGGTTCYLRNFRLSYDNAADGIAVDSANS